MEIFNRVFRDLIKKRVINSKSRSNKLIKGFSFSIKNKILKEIDYNPEDFTTYNYERIKKKAFDIYAYKEKKRRYIEAINPKYIKLKEKYLDIIIQRIVFNRRDYFFLLIPFKSLIDNT